MKSYDFRVVVTIVAVVVVAVAVVVVFVVVVLADVVVLLFLLTLLQSFLSTQRCVIGDSYVINTALQHCV